MPTARTSSTVPAIGEGKRGAAEGYLAYLLRQANQALRLELDRVLAGLGITGPQFLILTMIENYPGASGADIARLTQLTPQTVNTITRNLERSGLVIKRPAPDHGRILHLALTERGRHLLLAAREPTLDLEAKVRAPLSAAEEQVVRRWLVAVAGQLATSEVPAGDPARSLGEDDVAGGR